MANLRLAAWTFGLLAVALLSGVGVRQILHRATQAELYEKTVVGMEQEVSALRAQGEKTLAEDLVFDKDSARYRVSIERAMRLVAEDNRLLSQPGQVPSSGGIAAQVPSKSASTAANTSSESSASASGAPEEKPATAPKRATSTPPTGPDNGDKGKTPSTSTPD